MNDKTDPSALSPELARQFVAGTLARIERTQPDFFPFLMAEIHARDPGFQLSGIFDSIGDIGSSLSSAISSAATAYGGVLINRENAKTQSMIAQDNAKAQIDVMNAQLKAQTAATNNQFAQQTLALQQQQLLKTGAAFNGSSSVSPTVLIIGGVAVLGLIALMAMKK